MTSNDNQSRRAFVDAKAYEGVRKDRNKEKYSSNDVLEKDTYGNICSHPKIFLCPGNQNVPCEILVQRYLDILVSREINISVDY